MADSTQFVLDNSLTAGIAEWFKTNTYFTGFFKTINDYHRIDNPQPELTAVNIYLLPTNTRQKPSKVIGKVRIEIIFNIAEQREFKFKQVYRVLNTVRGQILYNPTYLQKYLSTYYVPGLQMIQSQNDIDHSMVSAAILKRMGTVTVPITLDYQIDILLNQRALWARGNDYWSPDVDVYNEIEEIEIDITEKPYPHS